jgi:hypothetical protein
MSGNKPRPVSEVQQKNAEQLVENLAVLDSVCTVLETTREAMSGGNKKKALDLLDLSKSAVQSAAKRVLVHARKLSNVSFSRLDRNEASLAVREKRLNFWKRTPSKSEKAVNALKEFVRSVQQEDEDKKKAAAPSKITRTENKVTCEKSPVKKKRDSKKTPEKMKRGKKNSNNPDVEDVENVEPVNAPRKINFEDVQLLSP